MRTRTRAFLREPLPWHPIIISATAFLLGCGTLHAERLFEENFDTPIPGWTGVQPQDALAYGSGPMRWTFGPGSEAITESSNLFTDSSAFSTTATAPMLINDSDSGEVFTLRSTITMGDNDGAGLVFGYHDERNFFRISFGIQPRDGFPFDSWSLDRMVAGTSTILSGDSGDPLFNPGFVPVQGVPFEVVISARAGGLLDLRVVEPPGNGLEVSLVEDLVLPSSATGKVGLMQWGMSGGAPSGVRFTDLSLSPGEIANYPVTVLVDWQEVVPSNSRGEDRLDDGELGNWGLSIGPQSSYGTLNEDANSSRNANDLGGNSHIDFISSMLVAGDETWTDYCLKARFLGHDDDAFGAIVRYQDADNFYRIALAESPSAAGRPWQGLSIQKKAGGVWSELAHEEVPTFIPVEGTVYDLAALVAGRRIAVSITSDPEGPAPVTHRFGPFVDPDEPIESGKIGFFSWSMNWLQVDNVTVDAIPPPRINEIELQIDQIALEVESFGAPYDAQRSTDLSNWQTVEEGIEAAVWLGEVPAGERAFWRLVR